MAQKQHNLTAWSWRAGTTNGIPQADPLKSWTPVTAFPSVIQMELLAHKLIPDPNIGENERQIQWVSDVDWEYSATFSSPPEAASDEDVECDLVFEGLDTIATVTLNGTEILKSDNMFIPARVGVKGLLRPLGEDNELHITFESITKVARGLEEKFGARTSMMRDKKRMHVRKAQYQWGWDWGPIVLTAGPYLPVYLETYTSRLQNVHVRTTQTDDHSSAQVTIHFDVVNLKHDSSTKISIIDSTSAEVASTIVNISDTKGTATLEVPSPKLWWPNGQGSPHVYTASLTLLSPSSTPYDMSSTRFGIRTIELIQRPLANAPGTTFIFRVNGRDIFCQGGNWIPADNLLPTITKKRYQDWMELARFNHLNMIRVWGGGIYENEDFFDACDDNGLLVWVDYAFACGDYPTHDAFIENVRAEAEVQTARMRNHPSLALLCGGNEDFMLADFDKVEYDHSDLTGPFDDKPFPQRKIYLSLLPPIAARLCPDVPYWANSPYGGPIANDPTIGDVHAWSVWHQEQLPYQSYQSISGRFVSEFGMHGFPVTRTISYFTQDANPSELHPQSRLIDCHNKGHGAHTRIARYLAENFRFDMSSLDNFVYSSQLMQSEAYGYALRGWKRLFNGEGDERCAGAVIWQLNDVYPVTSWSYVDYFLQPKPAFYTIRREFAPVSIGVERTPDTRWVDEDKPPVSYIPSFEVFAHNTGVQDVECELILQAYDFASGRYTELAGEDGKRAVTLKAGRNTELGALKSQCAWREDSLVILEARILSEGKELARFVDWPEPYRYLYWPASTSISLTVVEGEGEWENVVVASSDQPIKGLWVEAVYNGTEGVGDPEPLWEDNMVDLMPGQERRMGVRGLKGRGVHGRFLADWEVKT
ncbi:related to beta-mannosidase [Cephalotrichum gorgonifer]|uniref:Beta-mannosidase B n=1 Tax=Cephalotrichum gorgonifer TaxID=2041049 RepID=A0AAE8MWI0_9PEZI|nr:related to beta-mannosidase [Cephalotrichum gorgonifer]